MDWYEQLQSARKGEEGKGSSASCSDAPIMTALETLHRAELGLTDRESLRILQLGNFLREFWIYSDL